MLTSETVVVLLKRAFSTSYHGCSCRRRRCSCKERCRCRVGWYDLRCDWCWCDGRGSRCSRRKFSAGHKGCKRDRSRARGWGNTCRSVSARNEGVYQDGWVRCASWKGDTEHDSDEEISTENNLWNQIGQRKGQRIKRTGQQELSIWLHGTCRRVKKWFTLPLRI